MEYEDYYHDDPIGEEHRDSASTSRGKKFLSLILTCSMIFLGTTFAAKINLGGNLTQEFGQGSLRFSSCSGSDSISITPKATFTNQSGGGSYKVSSVEFTNVPAGCDGFDLTLLVFDSSTSSAKALYLTDSTTVIIAARSGIFSKPSSSSGYTVSNPASRAFTVTFTTPVLLANDAARFTLQSGPGVASVILTCAQGGSCTLGQTGPGGGTVFYYSAAGFNCGPTRTSTGSPSGGLCKYLEVAPAGWYGTANDPALVWADAAYQNTLLSGDVSAIGAGYMNSLLILAQGNGSTTAAGACRAYTGGGLSDWYLPSTTELVQLQSYVTSSPYSSSSPGLGYLRGGGYNSYGYYWSSGQYTGLANTANILSIVNGGGGVPKSWNVNTRAIRAF